MAGAVALLTFIFIQYETILLFFLFIFCWCVWMQVMFDGSDRSSIERSMNAVRMRIPPLESSNSGWIRWNSFLLMMMIRLG